MAELLMILLSGWTKTLIKTIDYNRNSLNLFDVSAY